METQGNCSFNRIPNYVQLASGGHWSVVADKVQSCTGTCDVFSCRAQDLPCTHCSMICMQLVCNALVSPVAPWRYLEYHPILTLMDDCVWGWECCRGSMRTCVCVPVTMGSPADCWQDRSLLLRSSRSSVMVGSMRHGVNLHLSTSPNSFTDVYTASNRQSAWRQ